MNSEQIERDATTFIAKNINGTPSKHGQFICSRDGGRILTFYLRAFGENRVRLFQAINLFQCVVCFQFYAMIEGQKTLMPLKFMRQEEYDKLILLQKSKEEEVKK